MKRIVVTSTTVALAIALAACSSSPSDGSTDIESSDARSGCIPTRDAAADTGSSGGSDASAANDAGTSAPDASAPSDASGGDASGPSGAIWQPKPGTTWQWQLSGTLDTSLNVAMYDIDLFDNAASVIAGLKARGIKVVCYVDVGSWEPGRPDASQFPSSVIGSVMDGWPDEKWLDIRSNTVRDLMAKRFDVAAQKGCDGVEPDNVDGYTNSTGFPLTAAAQLSYNKFLAKSAHARGLSVALENDPDQVQDLVGDFDFELDEQCFQYSECNALLPFIQAGKAVFEVEYGAASKASTVCPKANALNFDTLIKNLALDAPRTACR